MEKTSYKFLEWFTVLFVVMLLISNIIAGKIVEIGGLLIPAAVFLFPFTYIFGDIVTEVYGYEADRKRIWMGFFANVLMVAVFVFVIALPFPDFWQNQKAFESVLGQVPRIVIASLLSFWVGSFLNSYTMSIMKTAMRKIDKKDRYLFVRTIGSTLVGEGADTMMFIFLAFFGTMPTNVVFQLIMVQFLFKVGIEIVMTPATYFIVSLVKRKENTDVVGADSYNPLKIN